ncbi:autotransporter outer membrane beta-barrel domain-containing protein, partial [Bartonella sp. CL1QHWL]|uniref:autotransporter outer membrane beta-barrel domain-containing protein n=3 Tax=unclassified Bartonella TaxID=2645622 RepID=UPI0035D08BE1
MVNIFKNYRLTFTTVAFSFFWVVNINAGFHAFAAPCDETGSFYTCSDGKKHTLENKTYNLKSSQEHAPDSAPIKAIYVEKAGTVVDASQINVYGDDSGQILTYGAYAKYGARLNLKNSNFKNVRALHAENAVISMTDGSITETSHAMYALGEEADIALVRVKIEIEPDNLQDIGFVSRLGAKIRMSGSTVTFNGKGRFSSFYGGGYNFDSTIIKGKGKQKTTIVDEEGFDKIPEAFDVSQGSNVQLSNSSIELSDMHGFLVKNSSVDVNDKEKLLWKAFSSSDEFKKTNIKINKSNVSVQGKGVHGLYFYGLEPEEGFRIADSTNEMLLQGRNIIIGKAFVQLSKTNFTVPEGIAIYSTGTDGFGAKATLELLDDTKISGDLLIKTEKDSSLLVQAYSSTLIGGVRIEDRSRVDLQLKNGSTWYLTKSKYQGLEEKDVTVSSLSTLSLLDSTLVFEKYVSQDYQTLHIGKKIYNKEDVYALDDIGKTAGVDDVYNKVYSAEGNSRIKMSTFMNNDGSFDPQKTDRVLIYGDVLGTTLIGMEKFQKASDTNVIDGSHQSVSIIQVFGKAKEDTFKLLNDYVAINGFPYQYKLRAYGPGSSSGEASPENRLVEGEGDFWDFRLESVYINPELDPSESISVPSIKPTSTVLPPKSEAETIPSERPSETIAPEQPPSVEPSLIPSTPSLPETSEPSETFIPTDSTLTPSAPVSPALPSVPSVPEDASSVQPMPASLVPVETSTDEVLPSKPSVLEDISSTDSVPTPSAPVEPRVPFVPTVPESPSTDEVLPSEPSIPVSPSSPDFVPTPSVPVEPRVPFVPTVPEAPSTDEVLPSEPSIPEDHSFVQPMPAPFVPVEDSTDEVRPSEPSVPEDTSSPDSVSPPSAPVEPARPSVPIVPEDHSFVQPMPAPFVPVEDSTDEVRPSEPSIPEDTSSPDSVSPPSAPVEPVRPSVPTVPEDHSFVQPMPAPFVPVEDSTDEVRPSELSVPEDTSSPDSVPTPSTPVEPVRPSVPTVPEDPSAVQPMPAPFVPVEDSTDEVRPSELSV